MREKRHLGEANPAARRLPRARLGCWGRIAALATAMLGRSRWVSVAGAKKPLHPFVVGALRGSVLSPFGFVKLGSVDSAAKRPGNHPELGGESRQTLATSNAATDLLDLLFG